MDYREKLHRRQGIDFLSQVYETGEKGIFVLGTCATMGFKRVEVDKALAR